jgi:hypothetical protein
VPGRPSLARAGSIEIDGYLNTKVGGVLLCSIAEDAGASKEIPCAKALKLLRLGWLTLGSLEPNSLSVHQQLLRKIQNNNKEIEKVEKEPNRKNDLRPCLVSESFSLTPITSMLRQMHEVLNVD